MKKLFIDSTAEARLTLLQELTQQLECFCRNSDNFVGGLTTEIEVQLGSGATAAPVEKVLEFVTSRG